MVGIQIFVLPLAAFSPLFTIDMVFDILQKVSLPSLLGINPVLLYHGLTLAALIPSSLAPSVASHALG